MKHNIAFDITTHYSNIYDDFCLIGGIFEEKYLSPIIEKIDNLNNGYITSILNKHEYTGKIGETILLHNTPNIPFQKILLVGCGIKQNFNKETYKKTTYHAINTLKNTNTKQIISFLTELEIKECNNYWKIRYAIEIIQQVLYSFEKFKNDTQKVDPKLQNVVFYIKDFNELKNSQQGIIHGTIISRNINISKNISNMPPNFCNSEYLVKKSQTLEKMCNRTTVEIIDENKMQKLGMNAYLSVGQASNNPSLMSIIKYFGDENHAIQPLIIIGKGVTFDSGGLSIKPAEKMDEMKYDMCGASSVYAILRTVIQLNLPINIIGILATCENMISSSSLRPGDIIKTLSGKTVEIENTDAEGRLILCDVLTYITRFNPKIVIDIATLTGACSIALGQHYTGLMSNNNSLADQLITAGNETDDKVWRFPLDSKFHDQLKSNIADMKNVGGKLGSIITAGCFLEKFVGNYCWAHLDIAGTAWISSNKQNNATGRPINLIIQFLLNSINKMQ